MQKSLNRRKFLKYGLYGGAALGLGSALLPGGCTSRRKEQRLNVVIISIDTLRADHVSCYGYKSKVQITPNIDRLASQGTRFSNAFTTMPVTLPAHGSLMSSFYPSHLATRRNGATILLGVKTLAEILQARGYNTAAFVSSAVLDRRCGLNQGFVTYDDAHMRSRRLAEETIEKTQAWLQENKRDTFFLFVHLFDPHSPYYAPEPYRKRFDAPETPAPHAVEFISSKDSFTPEINKRYIAAYDAEIAYADWAIGQLTDRLENLGLDANTIVVLLSDHGETLDELLERYGYVFDHGEFLYTHQLRIPLVFRMPMFNSSYKPGTVCDGPVSIIDVMPTILNALAVKNKNRMMGVSLLPALCGQTITPRPIFSERRIFEKVPKPYMAGNDYSIIENQWHLIYSTARQAELYNMSEDPLEAADLAAKNSQANALAAKVIQWANQLKPMFGPPAFEMDRQAIERLRSLGYVE